MRLPETYRVVGVRADGTHIVLNTGLSLETSTRLQHAAHNTVMYPEVLVEYEAVRSAKPTQAAPDASAKYTFNA